MIVLSGTDFVRQFKNSLEKLVQIYKIKELQHSQQVATMKETH